MESSTENVRSECEWTEHSGRLTSISLIDSGTDKVLCTTKISSVVVGDVASQQGLNKHFRSQGDVSTTLFKLFESLRSS